MTTATLRKLLTLDEIAIMVGVSRLTIHNWIKEGRFPDATVKVGATRRRFRWDPAEVEAFVRGEWRPRGKGKN
jgi:excisionase family DNA binding protein